MLERFAVSIAGATIIAVLGKLALLYHDDKTADKDWFVGSIEQPILTHLLLVVFLVFFRGKMMHDDAAFFADLSKGGVFRDTTGARVLIKAGLLFGYVSWLLWAPAVYFLDDLKKFSGFMIASLVLSTVWLVMDLCARAKPEWRRAFWVIPNIVYGVLLALLWNPAWASMAAALLVVVLVIDWLVSDPFSGHV